MFGKRISTNGLYLLELVTIEKVEYLSGEIEEYTYSSEKRWCLGREAKAWKYSYIDVFTGTTYKNIAEFGNNSVGDIGVRNRKSIITTKGWITEEEALYILQTMNPTYLPEKPKAFQKTK